MTHTHAPTNVDDRLYQAISMLSENQKEDLLVFINKLPFEKRSHQRKKYFTEVSYADIDCLATGFIQNISESGFYIEANSRFVLNEKLSFIFEHPTPKKPIKVTGEVVRKDQNGIGVRLAENIGNI